MGKSETVSANRNWPDRCFINQDFGKLGAMKPGKKWNKNKTPTEIYLHVSQQMPTSIQSFWTRMNHPAPLRFVNHHAASQESQLWLILQDRHLASYCAHVVFFKSTGIPSGEQ